MALAEKDAKDIQMPRSRYVRKKGRKRQKQQPEAGSGPDETPRTIVDALRPLCRSDIERKQIAKIEDACRGDRVRLAPIMTALKELEHHGNRRMRKAVHDLLNEPQRVLAEKKKAKERNPLGMYKYKPTQVEHKNPYTRGFWPYKK